MEDILSQVKQHILDDFPEDKNIIIAIDGRCGSGKSTLGELLKQELDCNLFHMDDFFLRPEQRTELRREEPGGNVDYERFEEQVLKPLTTTRDFSYKIFDCQSMQLQGDILVKSNRINIVEGSYSCHHNLWEYYDLHIFLSVDKQEQENRIARRNGAGKLQMFRNLWIPLEEKYFKAFDIEARCELRYSTSDL